VVPGGSFSSAALVVVTLPRDPRFTTRVAT
jgi:hypothetical protein